MKYSKPKIIKPPRRSRRLCVHHYAGCNGGRWGGMCGYTITCGGTIVRVDDECVGPACGMYKEREAKGGQK